MGVTKVFQVVENRIFFKCPSCGYKKTVAIPPNVQQISTRCPKCEELTRCRLNRRVRNREQQTGKVVMVTEDGKEYDISLYDISATGVGFDIPIGVARAKMISVGNTVKFRCSWNSQILGFGRYQVRSIRGQRVGAMRIAM